VFPCGRHIAILLGVGLTLLAARSYAQDTEVYPPLPKRLALVIGNANYERADKLPGSLIDARKMADVLTEVGFKVTKVEDLALRADFATLILPEFLRQLSEGDVVLVYFSGHGFTFGGENYLAPLQYPENIRKQEVLDHFLSATGLQEVISARRPSLLIMLLDSCRNIGDFFDETEEDRNEVVKSMSMPRFVKSNMVVGFATAAGSFATGRTDGNLSYYTEALASFIPLDKKDLDDVKRDVLIMVDRKTRSAQKPWFSESSTAEFRFVMNSKRFKQHKRAWESALKEGTKYAVETFLAKHGTGPYGPVARAWQKENPNAPNDRVSPVSPAAPEVAWAMNTGNNIVLPRIEGTVAPQATASAPVIVPSTAVPVSDTDASPSNDESSRRAHRNWAIERRFTPLDATAAPSRDDELSQLGSGGTSAPPPPGQPAPGGDVAPDPVGGSITLQSTAPPAPRSDPPPAPVSGPPLDAAAVAEEADAITNAADVADPAAANAQSLTRLGAAIVTTRVEARTLPSETAAASTILESGTSIIVEATELDAQGNSWLRGRTSPDSTPFYVRQTASESSTVDIGLPLREINLSADPDGLKSAVGETPLLAALQELKETGKIVTWVSIATPVVKDERQAGQYVLQAIYILSVLESSGVDRARITTLEGAVSDGDSVRLRIFGRDRS
jgi:hypothetical protein